MPANSIDTFFACTVIVSAAIIATAFLAVTMQERTGSLQDFGENEYLQKIADNIVLSCGTPLDWGSNATIVPSNLGLSKNGSFHQYQIDIDKIGRLNKLGSKALSYLELSRATRFRALALEISVSQILSMQVNLSATNKVGNSTNYAFTVSVNDISGPLSATLRGYIVGENFSNNFSGATSDDGIGYVSTQMPDSSNGSAIAVFFARALFCDQLTSYAVYSIDSLSQQEIPDRTFLQLSPLDYRLDLNPIYPNSSFERGYAFSYTHQLPLNFVSNSTNNTLQIPFFADKSPTVLVVCGSNNSVSFVTWSSYPAVPVNIGANFDNSERNVFTYIVTIGEAFYRLNISLGDVNA